MTVTTPHVVEVTDENFEQVVIEGSKERPVVVDLWASWCDPCKTLGPILEKVAQERAGAFLLAKLDVDANPVVAGSFGVQSIPTVIGFRDGEAVTGFVGSYPEDAVNQFVDSLLPTEAEIVADEAQAVEESGDLEGAEQRYREALDKDADNREAAIGLGRILAERGDLDGARELVVRHLPDPDAERVAALIRVRGWSSLDQTSALDGAKRSAAGGSYREALDTLLGLLSAEHDGAREAMVDLFSVLGEEDPLVPEYRLKLTNALF